MEWEAVLEWKGNRTSKGRALSSVGWGTPNFKLKGWSGKLDLSGKGTGLWTDGRSLVSGGTHQIFKLNEWDGKLELQGKGSKGWGGKLDWSGKQRGLWTEGRSLVSGGTSWALAFKNCKNPGPVNKSQRTRRRLVCRPWVFGVLRSAASSNQKTIGITKKTKKTRLTDKMGSSNAKSLEKTQKTKKTKTHRQNGAWLAHFVCEFWFFWFFWFSLWFFYVGRAHFVCEFWFLGFFWFSLWFFLCWKSPFCL